MRGERRADAVERALPQSAVCPVNAGEILDVLVRKGVGLDEACNMLLDLDPALGLRGTAVCGS